MCVCVCLTFVFRCIMQQELVDCWGLRRGRRRRRWRRPENEVTLPSLSCTFNTACANTGAWCLQVNEKGDATGPVAAPIQVTSTWMTWPEEEEYLVRPRPNPVTRSHRSSKFVDLPSPWANVGVQWTLVCDCKCCSSNKVCTWALGHGKSTFDPLFGRTSRFIDFPRVCLYVW